MTAPDPRAEYTLGLRMLADLLDTNPDIPLPYHGNGTALLWIIVSEKDQKATLAAIARALPGKVTKDVRDGSFDLKGQLAGLLVQVIAQRDEVCTRVVTGTETVTKTIPDPDVEVPLVEVTETVEQVEWICGPLLGRGDES